MEARRDSRAASGVGKSRLGTILLTAHRVAYASDGAAAGAKGRPTPLKILLHLNLDEWSVLSLRALLQLGWALGGKSDARRRHVLSASRTARETMVQAAALP